MAEELTPNDVRARWAYSELTSPSFSRFYNGPGVEELKEKARQSLPFGTLTVGERNLLALQFNAVRGPYFNPFLEGVATFRLVQWTRDQLGGAAVIPFFLPELGLPTRLGKTFKEWIEATPTKPLEDGHPRYAANIGGSHFNQNDPVTVGQRSGFPLVLLDGYHRAVRFWNTTDPGARLAAYVPR
jgi:hypothetical protein